MSLENLFEQLEGKRESQKRAFADFMKMGLPTKSLEEWHYTSVKTIFNKDYKVGAQHKISTPALTLENKDVIKVYFHNGELDAATDAQVQSWLKHNQEEVVPNYKDGVQALQNAFAKQTYTLSFPQQTKPIKVEIVSTSDEQSLSSLDLKIVLTPGADVSVLFSGFGGSKESSSLSLPKVQIEVNEGAKLTYVHAQLVNESSYELSQVIINAQASAQIKYLNIGIGGLISRQDLKLNVLGSEVNAEINGIAVLSGEQHLDNTTDINHHVGGSQTFQLYKGILDGSSRSAFSGKVYIAKDAQKANSEQLNNNLLLSSQAEADSRPMLQIYADDVKAAHGSTVGQLNAEELFYLQSRAINKEQAIKMLSYGFVADLLFKIEEPAFENALKARIEEAFNKLNVKA